VTLLVGVAMGDAAFLAADTRRTLFRGRTSLVRNRLTMEKTGDDPLGHEDGVRKLYPILGGWMGVAGAPCVEYVPRHFAGRELDEITAGQAVQFAAGFVKAAKMGFVAIEQLGTYVRLHSFGTHAPYGCGDDGVQVCYPPGTEYGDSPEAAAAETAALRERLMRCETPEQIIRRLAAFYRKIADLTEYVSEDMELRMILGGLHLTMEPQKKLPASDAALRRLFKPAQPARPVASASAG
jgi:hypothetical protein